MVQITPATRMVATAGIAGAILVAVACSSSGGVGGTGKNGDPSEAFTDSLEFGAGVSVTPLDGDQPEGSDGTGVSVEPLPGSGEPLTVKPGEAFDLRVPWSGGNISALIVGFGGSKYFRVDVPQGSTSTGGIVNVPVTVKPSVCGSLANVCHQIQCYEQVALPDGTTVTKAMAQSMVLNCTGGKDCNGNFVDGGAGCGSPADPCGVGCATVTVDPSPCFTGPISMPTGQFVPSGIWQKGGTATIPVDSYSVTLTLDVTTCRLSWGNNLSCGSWEVDLSKKTCFGSWGSIDTTGPTCAKVCPSSCSVQ